MTTTGQLQLCSCRQAAAILGVSLATVKRRAMSGRLRSLGKLDGRTGSYVFDMAVVLAAKPAQLPLDTA